MNENLEVKRFIDASDAFSSWIEDYESKSSNLLRLHMLLADLQSALVRLPMMAEDENEEEYPAQETPNCGVEIHVQRWTELTEKLLSLPIKNYRIMFDTLDEDENAAPVVGSLPDDLADIYLDLKKGRKEMDAGRLPQAIWDWRFGYFIHWGRHLTHAQCAIWDYLQNDGAAFQTLDEGSDARPF